ncbi:toprim domain-containing protein [Leptospira kirschneri]|uniref:DNA topoisomerase (ATP-hydrolyzing) n=2 Tax=Leptospira kirschneri TaxID=29507 RepID=A0A828Y3W4_9LEPT|nr:toprim domain-containing protein [Leptospira kirschneri]EMO78280.1 toprim domain protein [Leptospira kirschneri str. 200801925]EJO71005.1 toprim domain protein [Leptospira kirschneri serovar Grippotyphosa str. RM52]EKO49620.1 toprim domain protein [Leptospira kirschneri str. 200802841]EKP03676.1 toprim domain protein [Leptospira kirschneri str. 2008720114]EKQ83774.1 toprim domain protein [Leptospira kirschneri serovar Grippotyphosa str. Moskva]
MSNDKTKVKEKSSQERNFKKLSNVEHVRMRTGMWLGQNSASTFEQHFFRKNNEDKYEIVHEELEDVPAKLKCLDEACMNAVDEYRKNQKDKSIPEKDKMSKLIVQLSSDRKCVTIADNGRGIPAANAEGVYLHLMYGENFDDHVKQDHVAGQNGVGISLVRMVSNYFKVKTVNNGSSFKKLFTVHDDVKKQIRSYKLSKEDTERVFLYFDEHGKFTDCNLLTKDQIDKLAPLLKKTNMQELIEKASKEDHGTSVEFELNPKYFNNLDISFNVDLMKQYLQDIAMTNPGLEVQFVFKGKKEKYKFKKGLDEIFSHSDLVYYKMDYVAPGSASQLHLETYLVIGQNKNLTWVNSIFAPQGGSAIEYLENRICDEVRKKSQIVALEKKLKTSSTRNDVRNCFHMYVNARLLNPRFKSQDKSYLINDLNEDIRNAVDKHLDKFIKKTGLLEEIKLQMEKRTQLKAFEDAQKGLKKASRMNIPKLMPPTGKQGDPGRVLFVAEGDSAIAGLRPARNPKLHGLFPLRGKPLNCKGLSIAKAIANEELKNIVAIVGLPLDQKVKSLDELNYEKVSIITDADFDGYAIRSLMLSFFYEYWPELFELGFIHISSAPLYEVDVKFGDKKKETIFCIDDKDYEDLIKRVEKGGGEITRKKRNKGLGETGKEAMKFAVEECMTKITIGNKKEASKIQSLWFHKDYAEQRRDAISEYAMSVIED